MNGDSKVLWSIMRQAAKPGDGILTAVEAIDTLASLLSKTVVKATLHRALSITSIIENKPAA